MAIVPLADQGENEINFVLGALAGRQIQWIRIGEDIHVETFSFLENYARFRDVEVSPDGKIYALTESPNSLILLETNKEVVTSSSTWYEKEPMNCLTPNPVENILNFDSQVLEEVVELVVFSSNGEAVKNVYLQAGIRQLDVSDLSSGVYFIEFKSDTKSVISKFVKL